MTEPDTSPTLRVRYNFGTGPFHTAPVTGEPMVLGGTRYFFADAAPAQRAAGSQTIDVPTRMTASTDRPATVLRQWEYAGARYALDDTGRLRRMGGLSSTPASKPVVARPFINASYVRENAMIVARPSQVSSGKSYAKEPAYVAPALQSLKQEIGELKEEVRRANAPMPLERRILLGLGLAFLSASTVRYWMNKLDYSFEPRQKTAVVGPQTPGKSTRPVRQSRKIAAPRPPTYVSPPDPRAITEGYVAGPYVSLRPVTPR